MYMPTFTSFGVSEHLAALYRELYEGLANGTIAPEPGAEHQRGATPLETTLRALLG